MEEYPEELRTPPVTLACLVGCPDVHGLIAAHLHSQQPPVNVIALPDFSKISVIPPKKAPRENSDSVAGIIKRDWLSKHRTRIPSVVAALFTYENVSGDPAQWLQVCTDVDNLKATVRGRNIKLVLVIVTHSANRDYTSDDRVTALRKRAEVDTKNLISFVSNNQMELQQSLGRLSTSFADLANAYYKDEGRRIKVRLEKRSFNSLELNVRYCFKGAVYAEFRRDWLEALKLYEDAYHTLPEMVEKSSERPPTQHLVEIKTVAEYLHFKISTLLQHGGKNAEAILWFRKHTANYRKLLGAPEVAFLHWEWFSRQYLAFAQVLETSNVNGVQVSNVLPVATEKPTERELYPAHYYQLAAFYLKEKSKCLEVTASMPEDFGAADEESVVSSLYVGQFSRLLEREGHEIMQSLTDEEFVRYSIAEGKRFHDSFDIIALLNRSCEAYSSIKAERTATYGSVLMAREYFSVGELSNAKKIFDNVASVYRLEGWILPLWEALGYLRECSRNMNSVKDFMEYSLEMAALPLGDNASDVPSNGPAGPATLSQRERIHREAFEVACGESLGKSELKVNDDYPLYLDIDVASPLRAVLLALVAFHQPVVKPGCPSLITIALQSRLPADVEIDQLEVQFNQSECNFIIGNGQKPNAASISSLQPGRRVEIAHSLGLTPNKWLRLTYEIKSDHSGKLECIYVIARMGSYLTLCCRAESPASVNESPLWKFENLLQTTPTKDPCLAMSGQKAIQVEEPDPKVDLVLGSSGPAFVGEEFSLPVTVSSKGHAVRSGELKINLVDTRGGVLLSPREEEPISSDYLHVELVDVICSSSENQYETPPDSVQKIQPSFGMISVPSLEIGNTWSCHLKIRWNRPKPIMLFVSLGYSSENGQKVHVHKSLQIEGKPAVAISHRFLLPFRNHPLLLSKIKSVPEPDQVLPLPLNESTVLVIQVKNSSEVPLKLLSMSIDTEENNEACDFQPQSVDFREPVTHMPGEDFKQIFVVVPRMNVNKLKLGIVNLRWQRDSEKGNQSQISSSSQITKYRLPEVTVEIPPLVISFESPPHAILGISFIYSVKIINRTELIQEMKFSITDSPSFVSSGPHSDTVFVLPSSAHVLSYLLVPLGVGSLQLPPVTMTSVRYSAGFQPNMASTSIFVYPSQPRFKLNDT